MRMHTLKSFWWVAAVVLAAPAAGQTPGERLSDPDVKQIVADVDKARDRFEDQLDGSIKSSIIRNDKGEVSVERYLDDLQTNVKNLNDRFNSQYAASKEAETLLRQGTEIHRFIKSKPAEIKGGSEWDTLARELGRLAAAYQTTFPLADDAVVRRINDGEAASIADEVAKTADQMKRQLGQERALPKPAVDAAKQNLDALARQARTVKSRASDSKPATAEVRQLADLAQKLGSFVQGQSAMLPGTNGAWNALRAPLERLGQAYGMPIKAPGK